MVCATHTPHSLCVCVYTLTQSYRDRADATQPSRQAASPRNTCSSAAGAPHVFWRVLSVQRVYSISGPALVFVLCRFYTETAPTPDPEDWRGGELSPAATVCLLAGPTNSRHCAPGRCLCCEMVKNSRVAVAPWPRGGVLRSAPE